MAAATVDIAFLSSHYEIPESTFTTLTRTPTIDLVSQLLQSIAKKAREFDELKSDKLRLEVELENAVHSSESKIRVLKGSVEKGLGEVSNLRARLEESGEYCGFY
jgi:nucleoprotein TPR